MAVLEDSFGDIIKKARTGQRKSLEWVAEKAQVDGDRLEDFEDYIGTPTRHQVEAIAQALHLSPTKLAALVEGWTPRPLHLPPGVHLQCLTQGAIAVHCYILHFADHPECALIDTGLEPAELLTVLHSAPHPISQIWLTHGHGDHIGSLGEVYAAFPVPVLIGNDERPMLGSLAGRVELREMGNGDRFTFAGRSVEVRHTPGHTPGGVSYVVDGLVFVGDTLFAGSAGRANAGYDLLLNSIHEKLLTLPSETIILPGHGPATTVAEERQHNPFFKD